MDNAQKAIMIGVGLFITIIIISAVMLITSAGQDLITSSTDQLGNISSSLQSQLTSNYDETILNGSQVIAAIKSNNTTSGMILAVYNGTSVKEYGTAIPSENVDFTSQTSTVSIKATQTNSSKESVGLLSNSTDSSHYVASTAKYTAHLIKISDAVVGIYFRAN
jgi:xanthine/uracil/vitamin C permease (AzgA family)